MSFGDELKHDPHKGEHLSTIIQDVDRLGLIHLLEYIQNRQMNRQPLTALELHRYFLDAPRGDKVAMALGEKKLLQRLDELNILRLRKQMGKISVQCLELTDKGIEYLNTLKGHA